MERLLLWVLFVCFSVIAYSVIMGALMASGKEVSGKIPKGKVSIKALGKDMNLRKELWEWTEVAYLCTGEEIAAYSCVFQPERANKT